ncbi:MAG: hypothetical protein V1738_04800 [Patescibacteria group bacterium]
MARYRLLVLIGVVWSWFAIGCTEYQKLPIQIFVDGDYGDIEHQAIVDALDQWNDWAGWRYAYGDRVFDYRGRIDDDFTEADYGDQIHVAYRISEPNPDVQYLIDLYAGRGGVGAYSPMSDMFIVMYTVDAQLLELDARLRQEIAAGEIEPMDVDAYIRDRRYGLVQNFALHEFGHMLGLMHYNHRPGVMNSDGPNIYEGIDTLSDADLDAFCLIYDCCRTDR